MADLAQRVVSGSALVRARLHQWGSACAVIVVLALGAAAVGAEPIHTAPLPDRAASAAAIAPDDGGGVPATMSAPVSATMAARMIAAAPLGPVPAAALAAEAPATAAASATVATPSPGSAGIAAAPVAPVTPTTGATVASVAPSGASATTSASATAAQPRLAGDDAEYRPAATGGAAWRPEEVVEPKQRPESWPEGFAFLDNTGDRISEAIFNLLENIDIINLKVFQGSIALSTGRRVYDNHDVLGTWTVVDHLNLDLSYPLYQVGYPIAGTFTLGYSVGIGVGNDFLDIRQVRPENFDRLPALSDRAATIAAAPLPGAAPAPLLPPEADIGGPGDPAQAPAFRGLRRARYGRLWNLVGFPLRLPTQAAWVKHMEDGEIMSFTANGTLEVGPTLNWTLGLSRLRNALYANFSYSVYTTGQYRFTILKEDARYVRLRLTRLAEAGGDGEAGGRSDDVVHGLTVLSFKLGSNKTVVAPFSGSIINALGRRLDVVYRYDLSDPDAVRAYDAALEGRLVLTDRMAGGDAWRLTPETAPVRRLGTRDSDYTRDVHETGSKYGLLYRRTLRATVIAAELRSEFAAGIRRAYVAVAEDVNDWRFIWGTFRTETHTIRANVDHDQADDQMTLVVQGELSASDTSGPQLWADLDEVEGATGRPGFFPRPPAYGPIDDEPGLSPDDEFDRRRDPNDPRRHRRALPYNRTSFFYQVTYTQAQIDRFLAYPAAKRWAALEQAFGIEKGGWDSHFKRFAWHLEHAPDSVLNLVMIPLDIHYPKGSMLQHAERIRHDWDVATSKTTPIERARALATLFADRRYGRELVHLLRVVLPGEHVASVIQGSSYAFGNLRAEDSGAVPADPLTAREGRTFDFDHPGVWLTVDAAAALAGLSVVIDSPDQLRLNITLAEGRPPPTAIYLDLVEQRPWTGARTIARQAYAIPAGILHPGANTLVIDRHGHEFLAPLFAGLVVGKDYVLKAAASRDGYSWGPLAECHFVGQ